MKRQQSDNLADIQQMIIWNIIRPRPQIFMKFGLKLSTLKLASIRFLLRVLLIWNPLSSSRILEKDGVDGPRSDVFLFSVNLKRQNKSKKKLK